MGTLYIIGVGPGAPRHLTAAARAALNRCRAGLYFKTVRHPVARLCLRRGLQIRSLERLFKEASTSRGAARAAGRVLLSALDQRSPVGYAVPGNPADGELTVEYLRAQLARRGYRIKTIPGIGLSPSGEGASLKKLVKIMTLLRSSRGCPWDRRQTHFSIRGCLIEEAYEVVAAIERGDLAALEEELGDLLLQVVFHSEIAREKGHFNLENVIDGLSAKLIRRHPHVFGTGRATSLTEAAGRWEQVKELERASSGPGSIEVDPGLPALLRAYKIQQRAAGLGFDWPSLEGAVNKLREEAEELRDAYGQGNAGKIEEEFGDLLFAAVNVARFLKLNPELALGKALRKFLARFAYVSAQVARRNRPFSSYSLEQLDCWWKEAKTTEEKSTDKAGITVKKAK